MMKKLHVLFLLVACSLGVVAQANVSLLASFAKIQPTPAHLKKWAHVDAVFPITAITPGAAKVMLYSMVPPTTGTQLNPTFEVQFIPSGKKAIPEGSIEQKDISADTTEGKQPLDFRQWLKTPTNTVLANGFRGFIRYSADLYYQAAPSTVGPESGAGYIGPTKFADYNSKEVQTFLANNNLTTEKVGSNPGLVGTLPYCDGTNKASYAALNGGDCGSKSNLMEAGLRSLGIPARPTIGWLIRESGATEPHIKTEMVNQGWWTSLEPTGYRKYIDVRSFIGLDGNWSPHELTMHIGYNIQAEFHDAEQNIHLLGPVQFMQLPVIIVQNAEGHKIPASVGYPTITLSQ
jgi:hypothetical protein